MTDNINNLPNYNNTNYPLSVKNQLENYEFTKDDAEKLRYHQYIPKEFFTSNSSIRGLLLVHAMGTGKTRVAVSIAEYYHANEPSRQILILLPKSLENNFRSNINEFSSKTEAEMNKYKFISLNSGNMFERMKNIDKSAEELAYEKKLGEFMEDITRKNSLNHSLLIIDEAHNLFNGITNGSKNAVKLYDLIIKSKNVKLLFLTGTPIVNNPFELVPCFNMLRGPIYTGSRSNKLGGSLGSSAIPKHTLLFTESYNDFKDFFIDVKNNKIKNKSKFKNRIYGLTSYYSDVYFPKSEVREGFPKKLPTIVEKVHMSKYQFTAYSQIRSMEIDEDKMKKSFRGNDTRFSSSLGGGGTYRVKSRQVSNYAIPEYALGPVNGKKARKKFIDKITDSDLQNTDKYSPKFSKIISNINKHVNGTGIVYSQFVSGEGLGILARVMLSNGWSNYLDDDTGDEFDINIKKKPNKTFAILSGDISIDDRSSLLKIFNSVENSNGSVIKVLLLSGAVAEGIDLKRVRHVHIMEPFWNYARINQVETRAIRYNSHIDLPAKEQNVQTYIYLSTYPADFKGKIAEYTTDIDLYIKSVNGMKLIDSFMLSIAESSIDCHIHKKHLPDDLKKAINCTICSPNNKQLFNPLIIKDINEESNCVPLTTEKLIVEEISIPDTDEKYYFTSTNIEDIKLYYFNNKIQGYTEMPREHPNYGNIMSAIIEEKKY